MQAEDISKAGLPVFDLISIGSQTNLKVRVLLPLGLDDRSEHSYNSYNRKRGAPAQILSLARQFVELRGQIGT